ncbi:MAG TPA: lamin tail domain-containing protein, partial [bacterium]|nr:lamin tail domain-containing protein [bacterium]
MHKAGLLLLFMFPCLAVSQSLVINEILASNQATIEDEDGNSSDYIELVNIGTAQVQLEGYGLSDDPRVRKWRFGRGVLGPGEHLLVFASDKNKKDVYWHTNFKVSASGETLVLTDATGATVDRVDLPASEPDIAYGRVSDGASSWIFQSPTPGTA